MLLDRKVIINRGVLKVLLSKSGLLRHCNAGQPSYVAVNGLICVAQAAVTSFGAVRPLFLFLAFDRPRREFDVLEQEWG